MSISYKHPVPLGTVDRDRTPCELAWVRQRQLELARQGQVRASADYAESARKIRGGTPVRRMMPPGRRILDSPPVPRLLAGP